MQGDFKFPLTPFVKGEKEGVEPINFVVYMTPPRAITGFQET
jgi:hypothetical protein